MNQSIEQGSSMESQSSLNISGAVLETKQVAQTKVCQGCERRVPCAARTCMNASKEGCGLVFAKRTKSLMDRMPKGKTNPTVQRNIIEGRLLGLNDQHGVNAIVIYAKRCESAKNNVSYTFDHYTTPGWATNFFGTKGQTTQYGDAVMKLVKQEFQLGNCNSTQSELVPHIEAAEELTTGESDAHATGDVEVVEAAENDNTEMKLTIKSKSDLSPRDVLAVYASPESGDGFWLFLTTSFKKKNIFGRWLNQSQEGGYSLENKDSILWNSVLRIGKELENFYVLPEFDFNSDYVLNPDIISKLNQEVKYL